MKTFAEMLKDKDRPFTQDMREAVEAFWTAVCEHRKSDYAEMHPLDEMIASPPAKEPESVEGEYLDDPDDIGYIFDWKSPLPFKTGDQIRITKIEGNER